MPSLFKLGLIVSAHRDPEQLAVLLTALGHPQVNVYLHIDKGTEAAPFHAALAAADLSETHWLPRRRTPWGTDRTVLAELDGMRQAQTDGCDYVATISGQDFPVRPVEEIVSFYETNRDRTYVHHFPLPHDLWLLGGRARTDFYTYLLFGRPLTCFPRGEDVDPIVAEFTLKGRMLNTALRAWTLTKPRRSFPSYVSPFGGEAWLNLSSDAVAHVLSFVEQHPDYATYHRHTSCATEMFTQSIIAGTDFAKTHEIVDDDLRYIVWEDTSDKHPRTLTLEDLPTMTSGSDMFARKLVSSRDTELYAELRHRLAV